ncbi:MAG: DUF167 domain-containing protein [Candidatus Aminicenantales bacterium]
MKDNQGIVLTVTVRPRTPQQRVERIDSTTYKVSVHSPPVRGKANQEVIKLLAFYFNLPPSKLKIIKGQKSGQKLIRIEADKKEILTLSEEKETL